MRKFDESKPSDDAKPVDHKDWELPKPFEDEKEFEESIKNMDLGKEWTKKYYAYFDVPTTSNGPPPFPPKPPDLKLIKKRGDEKTATGKEKELIEAAKRALTHTWRAYWFLYKARQRFQREGSVGE